MTKHARKLIGLTALLSSLSVPAALGQLGYNGAGQGVSTQLVDARAGLEAGLARRSQIDAQLSAIGPRRERLRRDVAEHGRALYRMSRNGMVPMAGGFDALLTHASRVARLERLVGSELAELRTLEEQRVALEREARSLDQSNLASNEQVRALEAARVTMAQEAASRSLFDRAFSDVASRKANDPRTRYGLTLVGSVATESFANQRGSLALPVSGPSNVREARRAESDGPGVELTASPSAAVRAAAAGRVAFAERYGSYGQIVILDHGDRYYTVYGGLGSIDVQVGDDLSKSARLGTAGMEPIYFEVRRGTKPQNPRAWLGL